MVKKVLNIKELIEHLPEPNGPSERTILRWVASGKIPTLPREKRQGVKVLFSKVEIDKWLSNGRRNIPI